MEDAMQADTFRRRTNGTADIDRYRARALSDRAAVRTDFFEGMSKLARPALAAALITLILFALFNQNPARNVAATTGSSTTISLK
jgi:hypothetical protein